MSISRRTFIKIGAAAVAATATSGLMSDWWGMDRYAAADPGTDGDAIIPTFCELCFWKCGVLAHRKNGKVTKIVGNPDHPLSNGRLCPRGTGGAGLLYDPDRLKQPLVRVGKNTKNPKFEPVSWEVALDEIAENMQRIRKRYGPEAMALFSHGFGGSWFKHLFKAYGSKNIGAPSYAQCRGAREEGYRLVFGSSLGSPEPIDMPNTRCLTLIGSHLGENMHNTQVQEFADAVDRGIDIVVVDPRFSVAASKARHWLPVKPGTDSALLLAWIHVMVKEKLYDREYIDKYAVGLDKLAEHVKDKTPEWAAVRTGVSAELIRKSIHTIAGARPASLIHPGRRSAWYGNDTGRTHLMAILAALLGSWGRRGGYISPTRMQVPKLDTPPYPEAKLPADQPKGNPYPLSGEVLANGLCDAAIPGKADYQIHGWFVYGSNLVHTLPNPKHTIEAIKSLDFLVTVDVLPVEIVGWSDVVLPESTYLERHDDLFSARYKEPFVALRQPVVEPMYDTKPGWWIAKQLGERLGLEDYFPFEDAEDAIKQRVEAAGMSYAVLSEKGVIVGKKAPVSQEDGLEPTFATPSGKIELYSDQLAEMGFRGLPEYEPLPEPPPGQFRLITGRAPMHTFGRTTNNPFLTQVMSENEVWINADAARGLPGFELEPMVDGEYVKLTNQDGVVSNAVRVKLTQRIRGDAVYMVHGFGHTAKKLSRGRKGASTSELNTSNKTDRLMGGTSVHNNFVRIERAEVRA
jgi:thiosulfate reductase/polysulfide reductase chain A